MTMVVSVLSSLLQSCSGRYAIYRMVSNASLALCGLGEKLSARPSAWIELLERFSKSLGDFGVMLRLGDDLGMALHTKQYGWGRHERDCVIRVLSVISNIVNQFFFPVEHIAWAIDRGIIHARSSLQWWYCGTMLWAISLSLSILKCIWSLVKLQLKKKRLSSHRSDQSNAETLKQIETEQFNERLVLCESFSDFCCAIHWLPRGFLWSGKLSKLTVGLLGSVSSAVGLYRQVSQL